MHAISQHKTKVSPLNTSLNSPGGEWRIKSDTILTCQIYSNTELHMQYSFVYPSPNLKTLLLLKQCDIKIIKYQFGRIQVPKSGQVRLQLDLNYR